MIKKNSSELTAKAQLKIVGKIILSCHRKLTPTALSDAILYCRLLPRNILYVDSTETEPA